MNLRPSSAQIRRLRRMPLVSPRLWLRRTVFWVGAVVVSLVAIAFATASDAASWLFTWLVTRYAWSSLIISPAGLVLAVLLTRRFFPGASGSGIPQVIAALHMNDLASIGRILSLRIAAGKIVLTLLGLLSGGSIGREGPTVQVGAAVMQALGQLLNMPRASAQRALLLAGGAAGVSAAFNTPLAGVVFAIEELSHSFEARASGTVLTAVIISGGCTLALVGNYSYFGSAPMAGGSLALAGAVVVCAIAGGLLGGGFSTILVQAAGGLPGRAGAWAGRHPLMFAGLCGLAVAVLGIVSGGATYGTGYAQARELVNGGAGGADWFFLAKMLATVATYLSGVPGGIFAPSLAVGAGLGHALSPLLPGVPPTTLVLLGMAAYFAGVVQAPITATVIVMEMTHNQNTAIPLLATALLAYGVSRLVCRRPLYGALARRILRASGHG